MAFVIGLLTFFMFLDCLVLILLVLIQLPKKEAGAGLAFGGSATDALFGAGSGTVLTKITKYSAGIFFVLAMMLSVMQGRYHNRTAADFSSKVGRTRTPPAATAPAQMPAPAAATNKLIIPQVESTNQPPLKLNVPPTATNQATPPSEKK